MDDERVASGLRRLRVRARLRQADAARLAGIPRQDAVAIEAGRLDGIAFGRIRRYARVVGARFDGELRWRGSDLERLLNRGHAAMHEATVRWLTAIGGWLIVPEVSFAYDRDRGVIDLIAWHAASRALLIIELKTRLVDLNALMGSMDIRQRVARRIARERGWTPASISMWVLVADVRTNHRILADHSTVLRLKFPMDGRAIRRWLARPEGSIAALSFLPHDRVTDLGLDIVAPRRVRRPAGDPGAHGSGRERRPMPRIGVTFGE